MNSKLVKYLPVTGHVIWPDSDKIITEPMHLNEGLWIPSDQETCPITPVKVVYYNGVWISKSVLPAVVAEYADFVHATLANADALVGQVISGIRNS